MLYVKYLCRRVRIGGQKLKATRGEPLGKVLVIVYRAIDDSKGERDYLALGFAFAGGFADMLFSLVPKMYVTSPDGAERQKHTAAEDRVKSRMGGKEVPRVVVYSVYLASSVSYLGIEKGVSLGVVDKHRGAFLGTAHLVVEIGHIEEGAFSRHGE